MIQDEELGGRLIGKSFSHLLCNPGASGMTRNVEVNNLSPVMANNKEAVQQLEADRRDREEIHGSNSFAIEMIASTTARFDIARFGSEVFRPSPRQSDLMIVAGTVTLKMAPVIKRIYAQMPDPKWVISMGACSSVGGPFNTYAVLQGVDKIVPTDVYVVGCPPRPENLFYALLKLQDKIDRMSLAKKPTEVRLEENMGENFKRQVMIAQVLQPK
jgi:NADH-quinone oxidoreductase subunit B